MPTNSHSFHVIRDDTPADEITRGAVLAIGNFDGVHRGHRAVIAETLRLAHVQRAPALAVTFEPHPRHYFQPDAAPFRLTDERNKLRLLAATGLDGAVVMTFNRDRASTSAADFINRDLIARLSPSGLVAGYDFHFGKGRTGTPAFLVEEGARHAIPVHIAERYEWQGEAVSSTLIRAALAEGDIDRANALLSYPWFTSGEVLHGQKRGRDLGYPTANLRLDPSLELRHGIYAIRAGLGERRWDGVASFGRRPQFDNGAPLLEAFLFDFSGDLYGAMLDVAFYGFIRPEARFETIEALIGQMDRDSATARAILSAAGDAFPPLGRIGT